MIVTSRRGTLVTGVERTQNASVEKSETQVESPAWHAKVLKETEARVDAGEETIGDWETAKRELRRRFE